jgi:hypothetical protein
MDHFWNGDCQNTCTIKINSVGCLITHAYLLGKRLNQLCLAPRRRYVTISRDLRMTDRGSCVSGYRHYGEHTHRHLRGHFDWGSLIKESRPAYDRSTSRFSGIAAGLQWTRELGKRRVESSNHNEEGRTRSPSTLRSKTFLCQSPMDVGANRLVNKRKKNRQTLLNVSIATHVP